MDGDRCVIPPAASASAAAAAATAAVSPVDRDVLTTQLNSAEREAEC